MKFLHHTGPSRIIPSVQDNDPAELFGHLPDVLLVDENQVFRNLDGDTELSRLEITWPDGIVSVVDMPSSGQLYTIERQSQP